MQTVSLGILSSLFFAVTFILNRLMAVTGDSFIWSASLRYVFMIPLLWPLVYFRGGIVTMWNEMMKNPWSWMVWSTVGFGLFYIPLCFASSYSPAWLVAGTWQFTIIAGSLLAPIFRKKLPLRGLFFSFIIVVGIMLMEWDQVTRVTLEDTLCGVLPLLLASFAYPLGNRKMMELCAGRLNAYQRVLGMTLASLPLWMIMSIIGFFTVGAPSKTQILQTFLVAICSGVVATVLFFSATDRTKGDVHRLATVEATQSGEVVFTLLLGWLILREQVPSGLAITGIIVVIVGMVLHSFLVHT
ncbi:MAG: multidrug resistance efflux transporter family protein [Acidibacillus sp.]|uniref:Multidrug resistance efflux transporter family protein n=1 Tax=Sulfoacidibacillus ferrooxidans TaxID=2005001 RepID=A0A9X1V917_9BACL|nr:multidrug resistance efflux transporter family protein [Sulfoacidibacillus ferrooxidans]MCI0183124.1 hypothetical protein [Sulfoacidibacillus ferrooxidans]MCY0893166.1 multidrug resistance efflux transporter family protein [Acidibacillus sp.]